MARHAAYRRRRQNKFSMFLVMTVIAMMIVVILVKSIELRQRYAEYQAREAELELQIEEEKKRTEEIAEFEKYTRTKKYIEEVAKDKLGLVNEDEIIFKDEE